MFYENRLWVATSKEKRLEILPQMANRHGLIAGATGTGKTVTLKVLAESFSDAGVPVFLADVKGDLAGMCQPGVATEGVKKRLAETKVPTEDFIYQKYPVCFWDIFAKKGLPLRTTISEMGPTLLARLLDLTATQEDILCYFLPHGSASHTNLLCLTIINPHHLQFETQWSEYPPA